jgi:hypothetical protein
VVVIERCDGLPDQHRQQARVWDGRRWMIKRVACRGLRAGPGRHDQRDRVAMPVVDGGFELSVTTAGRTHAAHLSSASRRAAAWVAEHRGGAN